MANDTEIRTKTDIFGIPEKTSDDEPVKEVVKDGDVVAEIATKTDIFGIPEKTSDGEPVKEVTKKD